MAKAMLGLIPHNKSLHNLVLFALTLLIQRASATEFKVGGSKGWSVPTDSNALTYNQWAKKHRFQVGDSLLFVYPPYRESVLQVNKDDYESCNTASPIKVFNDGNTSFKFNQSGSYHFISGIIDNCQKNEKMIVIVMAEKSIRASSDKNTTTTFESPPPSGIMEIVPAPVGEGGVSNATTTSKCSLITAFQLIWWFWDFLWLFASHSPVTNVTT